MPIEIRQAYLADIDQLMAWRMTVLREVFAVPANDPMTELAQQNLRYYQTALSADTHIACFAYAGEIIVGCGGMCLYQEMPSPDNPTGDCAYLMNIYTHPDHRQQGIGKMIVRWLLEQAKQKNITKIYLETSEDGRTLYQKMGFADMHDYMKYERDFVL